MNRTMTREDYILSLELKNRYCECVAVQPLRRLGVEIGILERACDRDYSEADLDNPKPEDKAHLEALKQKTDALEKEVRKYHEMLTSLVSKGRLKLVENNNQGRISPPVVTINCEECSQQIELQHE